MTVKGFFKGFWDVAELVKARAVGVGYWSDVAEVYLRQVGWLEDNSGEF